MGRSDRSNVPEGNDLVGLGDSLGGDVATGNSAEDAVGHSVNLSADAATARFLADARTIESSRSRARRHWLRQQATEGATFSGLLRSMAEGGKAVRLTVTGWPVSGVIVRADVDLVTVETDAGTVWVAPTAIESVEVESREGPAADDRPFGEGSNWASLLAGLLEERQTVDLRVEDRWFSGRLTGLGVDVVTLAGPDSTVYLPVRRIAALRLAQA